MPPLEWRTDWLPCKPFGRSIVFTSSSAMSKAFSPLNFFSQKSWHQRKRLLAQSRNGIDNYTKQLLPIKRGKNTAADGLVLDLLWKGSATGNKPHCQSHNNSLSWCAALRETSSSSRNCQYLSATFPITSSQRGKGQSQPKHRGWSFK